MNPKDSRPNLFPDPIEDRESLAQKLTRKFRRLGSAHSPSICLSTHLNTRLTTHLSIALLALLLLMPFIILIFSTLLMPVANYLGSEAYFSRTFDLLSQIVRRLGTVGLESVFLFTAVQAFLSAAVAMVLGILGAYGLIFAQGFLLERVAARKANWVTHGLEAAALLPNFAPVLLLILAVMKFLPRVEGIWGIVILHSMLNLGLVAVSVVRLIQLRLGRLTELAFVEGAGKWSYFRRAVLPTLKNDFLSLGFFVFTICFSSFAIPLVIGGSRGVTVEVLIYRAMRVDGDLVSALAIAFCQMLSLAVLALVLPRSTAAISRSNPNSSAGLFFRSTGRHLVSAPFGLLFLLLPPFLILASLFDGVIQGVQDFIRLRPLHEELLSQCLGSLFVGGLTAFLVSALLMALAWVQPEAGWRKFFLGYAAPSSVLTGLSLLIMWRATGFASLVKISIALTLIFTPAFYRMQWDSLLLGLADQGRIAGTLGATRSMIFWDVTMPQLFAPLGTLAGLASLWSWGDFALSSVIAERQLTLGMAAQSLMDSYRLDVATVYVWIIASGGVISYVFFKGVGRVLGSQSEL